MLQRRSSRFSVILEDQNVFEPAILFQVEDAVSEGPKHVFDSLRWQGGKIGIMVGGLNDDFMSADVVHSVKHALGLAVKVALDSERRKLVGNHPHRPSRRIPLRGRPAIWIRSVGLNFRWSLAFISVAEGTEPPLDLHVLAHEIGWALGAVGRNNYPTADNRIFSKFRQFPESFPQHCANFVFYAREAFANTSMCGRELRPS